MKQLQYKDFSLKFHEKNWRKGQPNVCQLELTFACPLHCRHCYTDCYNNPKDLKKELTTKQVIHLLDKVYNSGVLWLCLTGGDPLAREDFLKIYTYARKKGFIVTVFTSGILITEEMADSFKKLSPFCIELTLNGITKKTYEAVSGVKGSFEKVMPAIHRLKERNIPFKIKTQVTKQNIQELDKIRDFVEGLGLKFRPSTSLHARLNGDLAPCNLRIKPEEVLEVDERFKTSSMDEEERSPVPGHGSTNSPPLAPPTEPSRAKPRGKPQANTSLFHCAAGIDTFHIDLYGNMFLCSTVREPSVNLLKSEIADGFKLFKKIIAQRFKTDSKCKTCSIWDLCYRCPGRAHLETGNPEAPVEYFCKLAHLVARKNKNESKPTARRRTAD